MSPLICFTDGACKGNGKSKSIAGYATVWPENQEYNFASLLPVGRVHTNNRAEALGIITAFEQASIIDSTFERPLYIYTDSMLLVNSINKWIPNWKKHNWIKSDGKSVLNQDLLKIIDGHMMSAREFKVIHVKAHTKSDTFEAKWNAVADELAQQICVA